MPTALNDMKLKKWYLLKLYNADFMMNPILIDENIFRRYEDISANIKPERLKVFANKAQDLDLKPFLGYALYYDFIKHFNDDGTIKTDAPQHYKDLLNGSEYLDKNGHIVLYEGLLPTLLYFAFARFIEADAIRFTPSGPIIKRHDNSDNVTPQYIIKLVQQQRSVANAHANEVERFLWDHRADFPLWRFSNKNKTARQAGPRIRGVDKSEFNYPRSTYDQNSYLPLTEI